jgi:hypothetical protein
MKIIQYAAGVALVSLVACSNGSGTETSKDPSTVNGPVGSLRMDLRLPDGTIISSVNYSVTGGPQNISRSGAINVANSTVLKFQIGNLPVGSGYTMALAATTDGGVSCAGTSSFAVADNNTTLLAMDLVCGDGVSYDMDNNGDISVTVTVINDGGSSTGGSCPLVSGLTALPSEVAVGSSIALEGYSTSADGVTYAWSAASGAFSAATSAATEYTCAAAGDQSLTFQVTKSGCTPATKAVVVTCTGSGTDPVDSGVDSGTEQDSGTEPVDSGTEPVDSGTAPVDSGTEPADSGTAPVDSGTAPVDSGTPGSWPLGSEACVACQQTNCTNYFDENPFGACSDSGCQEVFACTFNSKCFTNLMNIPDCYCGPGIGVSICQEPAYVPTGVCKDVIKTGLEATTNPEVSARYINPQYPAGRAGQLATCIADLCITECGLQ